MRVRSGVLLAICTAVAFGAAGFFSAKSLSQLGWAQSKTEGKIWREISTSAQEAAGKQQTLMSFADLVKKASPAVVNVSFEKTVALFPQGNPFGNDPFEEFFRQFFGQIPREYHNKGLGSGFLINPDGYIVTNNHVISEADKITVKLKDDEKDYAAKVIGKDPKTDLALIKIDAGRPLPTLPLGDSDTMEVGDWVLAIGNPLGLSDTVTQGIISFKGRKEIHPNGQSGYYDFLQTDAAINPGNSGGPLLNIKGEVIGVNESMVGGAQNIGFAVPINMAKAVVPSLLAHGKVVRAWLGVHIQPVTRPLAESFGLKKSEGALIADVVPGGPADKAGLRAGDVIVEFGGKKISGSDDLPWIASNAGIGSKVQLKVFRGGAYKDFDVVLGELPESGKIAQAAPAEKGGKGIGITVSPVSPDIAQRLKMRPGKGVIVEEVKEESEAALAGVQANDIIFKVNDEETNSPQDFVKVVSGIKKGAMIRLLLRRGDNNVFIAFPKV